MKIDPKYFNLFAGIIAFFAMIAIVYFSLTYASSQRSGFVQDLGTGAELYNTWFVSTTGLDSLRAVDFKDRVVIIDFWSTWSEPALRSHKVLHQMLEATPAPNRPIVIAAAVRDADETVHQYAMDMGFDFMYVRGTTVFQSMKAPGVPTQVIYGPNGRLVDTRVGYKNASEYQVLDSLLTTASQRVP
jgi:thiol-disulfide isomerase/thioredoxin